MSTSAFQPNPPLKPADPAKAYRVGPDARGLWPERYELLDAWRGLAALAVVIHHVAHIFIGGPAVMLFFVISGYCIAAAADSCQRKGLGFGRFMLRRIRRIYPPYLLSLLFWALTRLLKLRLEQVNDLDRPLWHWIQNATLTQWTTLLANPIPHAASNRTLFVAAYWSLGYEEQFYILMGLAVFISTAVGLSIRSMVIGLLGISLIFNAFIPELCYGLFLDFWSVFGLGALVYYRLCRLQRPIHRRLVDAFLLFTLLTSVYLRWFAGIAWQADAPGLDANQREELRVIYTDLAVGALFALILIATRPFSQRLSSLRLYRPFAALGAITFSLYLIHQFNLKFARTIANRILEPLGLLDPNATPGHDSPLSITLQISVHIVIATVFWYFCERPFLNKPLAPVAPPPPAPPAPAA